ncbi:hypothetical protein ACVIIV_002965 [Bradyrhizobium sp. USDA 4354]
MTARCDALEGLFGKEMHNEYGWASVALKNPKPESVQPVHLVGQRNSGFTDPIHMMAILLNIATSSLLSIRPTVDNVIFLKIISDLSNDIGSVALTVEKASFAKAQAKPKPKKRARPAARKKKSK